MQTRHSIVVFMCALCVHACVHVCGPEEVGTGHKVCTFEV